MKKILILAAALLSVAACDKDSNYNDRYGDKAVIPPQGKALRVMTYNIYGARATSPDNAADLDAIAEVIRRQDPDFSNPQRSRRLHRAFGQRRAPSTRPRRKAWHGVALLESH